MARGHATYQSSDGARCTFHFEAGDHLSDQIGDTLTLGTFNGQAATVVFRKNFCWWPSVDPESGWTYGYISDLALAILYLLGAGQSNEEGRALTTEAAAIVNASRIALPSYPVDENHSGPGSPQLVGPLLPMADAILSTPGCPYDRVTIICTATGTQSVSDLYGTDGTDGSYRAQLDTEVCHGVEGDPRVLLRPGDHYVLTYGQGESDSSAGTVIGWGDAVTALLDHIRETDFPSSECIAICVSQFCPTTGSGTQENWDSIRSQQAALADANATPPRFVHTYQDSEKKPGDPNHMNTAGQERQGAERAASVMSVLAA
jgi:hypothetical protein